MYRKICTILQYVTINTICTYIYIEHGCQNSDLDPTILRFYDLTYPKRFKSFKDLYDRSGLIGSYNSDDPKRHWFLVIFFNFTESSIGPK